MQVQQDEVRTVLASELEADPALHRREEVNPRTMRQQPSKELHVGNVVLDVEQLACRRGTRRRGFGRCSDQLMSRRLIEPENEIPVAAGPRGPMCLPHIASVS